MVTYSPYTLKTLKFAFASVASAMIEFQLKGKNRGKKAIAICAVAKES